MELAPLKEKDIKTTDGVVFPYAIHWGCVSGQFCASVGEKVGIQSQDCEGQQPGCYKRSRCWSGASVLIGRGLRNRS